MPIIDALIAGLKKLKKHIRAQGKRKTKIKKVKRPAVRKKQKPARRKTKKAIKTVRHPQVKKKAFSKKPSVKKTSQLKKKTVKKAAAKPLSEKTDKKLVGEITHYFDKIKVVVIKITQDKVSVGDKLRIKGVKTDFTLTVSSLQIESVNVSSAKKGQLAGLKVAQEARPGDKVYK